MSTDEHAVNEQVVYVYGVTAGALDLSEAPHGVDAGRVVATDSDGVTALTSLVAARDYTGETIEVRAGDVDWVGPRAAAHDAVLTWASDRVDVLPFTMFTLFTNADAVRGMLRERRQSLAAALEHVKGAREYTLRVFQSVAPVDGDALANGNPRIAELEKLAAAATPGQRYLLERKLEKARREERSRGGAAVAADVASTLAAHSLDLVRSQLPPADGEAAARAVLDASFLVKRDRVDELRSALGALAEQYEPRGFRFEFTGPWPAYHFARAGG